MKKDRHFLSLPDSIKPHARDLLLNRIDQENRDYNRLKKYLNTDRITPEQFEREHNVRLGEIEQCALFLLGGFSKEYDEVVRAIEGDNWQMTLEQWLVEEDKE